MRKDEVCLRFESYFGPTFQRAFCTCGWTGAWHPSTPLPAARTLADREPRKAQQEEWEEHVRNCALFAGATKEDSE